MKTPAIPRSYVAWSGGQLHVRELGAGSVVLLLHQSPSSGAMWERLMPRLAGAGLRAIAPDQPGSGNSSNFQSPPDIAGYAHAMLELLDALHIESCDIVGHHTGAAVALQLAAANPSRVKRMVLWGIPLLDDELRGRLRTEPPPLFDDQGEEIARFWARRRELSGAGWSPAAMMRHTLEMLQAGFERPWAHWAVAKADMRALLQATTHPVLAMCGERDPVWSRSREAAGLLRQGRFAELHGAGLDVVDEATAAFAQFTLEFLLEAPEAGRGTTGRSPASS